MDAQLEDSVREAEKGYSVEGKGSLELGVASGDGSTAAIGFAGVPWYKGILDTVLHGVAGRNWRTREI